MDRILVLGGTGMLGRPVVSDLLGRHRVRLLTRGAANARDMFGDAIEVVEGSVANRDDLRAAMSECDAVHLNLTPATEYEAMRDVLEVADGRLDRITYVSATTLSEENRWFYRADIKMRTEELLRSSGVPHVMSCPDDPTEPLHSSTGRGKLRHLWRGEARDGQSASTKRETTSANNSGCSI